MLVSGPAYIWTRKSGGAASVDFETAVGIVRSDLENEGGDIFKAHLEILEDPLLSGTFSNFLSSGMEPLAALDSACTDLCGMFSSIDDEYLRARVDDLRDVVGRIRSAMCGEKSSAPVIPEGSIIVAEELFPSDTSLIDFSRIRGIVLSKGSSTSHVCIIARSKGIPVSIGTDISKIVPGSTVGFETADIGLDTIVKALRSAGRGVYANAGSLEDIKAAIDAGADGIGLLRTEFLFLGRETLPSEDEQFEFYRDAALACKGKPLVIRTLDIGADKPLESISIAGESNPMLGLRGIRLSLSRPEILRTQLKAIERASCYGDIRVMLPMVSVPEEIDAVECSLPLGIMVETPAVVLRAGEFASRCSFMSAGTNDLTQYIMAADRGNASVAYLYDGLNPSVLEALRIVARAAHGAGIQLGVCGELASDPRATSALLDAGVDYLSLNGLR